MRQGASVGSVSSPGHQATGLGSWRNLECGMDEDVLFLFWVGVIGGVIGYGVIG